MWNNPTDGCQLNKAIEEAIEEYLASEQYALDTINDLCHTKIFISGFLAGIKAAIELLD